MAIELIDPDETLEFMPSSEKDSENPTIIHLYPSDVRDSFKRNKLFNINRANGENSIEFADDDIWFDYLVGRIKMIENIAQTGGATTTLTDPGAIEDALSRMSSTIGSELFAFVMQNSSLTEEQAKN